MERIGYIKLHRKILDSAIFLDKPCEWLKIWIFILSTVNFSDNGTKTGSKFLQYALIARECRVTYNQVAKCIDWLKKEEMISVERRPNGGIIYVAKWSEYQGENYIPEANHKRIISESEANAINKNERMKEGKNEYNNIANKDSADFFPYFLYLFLDLGWEPGKSDSPDKLHEWIRGILKKEGILTASDAKALVYKFYMYWDSRRDEPGFNKKNWKTTLLNSPALPSNQSRYEKRK